ncbi:MAG TPA: FHA domain-containing protein [Humisphaera sp.]
MPDPIHLKHLSNSSLAGRATSFARAAVTLGRRPGNDVVFDPVRDLTVSGQHCRLVLDGDRLYVEDAGSRNGTFVNGRRITGRAAVGAADLIMLGERGPVLAASVGEPAAWPDAPTPLPATLVSTTEAMPTPLPPADLGLLGAAADELYGRTAPVPAVTPEPTAAQPPPGPSSHPPSDRPPSRASQGVKASVGMNTLVAELDKAAKRERRRLVALGLPVLLVLVAGTALASYFALRPRDVPVAGGPVPNGPGPAAVASPPGAPSASWQAVLERRKRSVYVLVDRDPDGNENGFGTAWSAAPGVLATGAHLAEAIDALPAGHTVLARSNAQPTTEVRVARARPHPGYRAFERMLRAYTPLDAGSGAELGYPTPFDVALLDLTDDTRAKQEPPLELADDAELARVGETSELAYVGFPMERAAEGGVNLRAPVAQAFVGTLTRRTDIFLAGADAARANFLQYSMPVQGGASGSPVFDRAGKVVGLISGNEHAAGANGARIPIAGRAYGPRSDAVRELLDGSAERNLERFVPEWRQHFRERFDRARAAGKYEDLAAARAVASFRARIAALPSASAWKPRVARQVFATTVKVTTDGTDAARAVRSDPVPVAGFYSAVVTTDDPDVSPGVAVDGVESALANRPPAAVAKGDESLGVGSASVASLPVRLEAGARLDVKVTGRSAEPGKVSILTVRLFQAVE